MERSNIVVIIDELETRELISRRQSKTDRRRYAGAAGSTPITAATPRPSLASTRCRA
jgi:hypothetical protein